MGFLLHNSGLRSKKLEGAPVVRAVAIFQQYSRLNYVNNTRDVRNVSLFIVMRDEFFCQMR